MKIKIAIVDSRILPEEERRLTLEGFRVITLPPYSKLCAPVASHADMLVHRIDNELISFADYCEKVSYVFSDLSRLVTPSGVRLSFTSDEVLPEYPRDARLNALRMGKILFCKTDTVSPYLAEAAKSKGLSLVHTAQGYPACTTLKLSEEAAITADLGMSKVLKEHGIRVTVIENGDISLPPYDYGFIGGAGGVYGGKLYFFGNPALHRDYEKISRSAADEGLELVSLSCGALRDLGGIIFAEGDIY